MTWQILFSSSTSLAQSQSRDVDVPFSSTSTGAMATRVNVLTLLKQRGRSATEDFTSCDSNMPRSLAVVSPIYVHNDRY